MTKGYNADKYYTRFEGRCQNYASGIGKDIFNHLYSLSH